MVRVNLLKARMVEMGISTEDLAETLGVNKSTVYRKMQNPDALSVREVEAIAHVLLLNGGAAMNIFFPRLSHICDKTKEGTGIGR